jgi:hypothetical protein
MQKYLAVKKYINRTIFLGVIVAAAAFLIALAQPKQYLLVGKVVVFPTGSATAEKNLELEVGNTVQILNSAAFKTNAFQAVAGNFAYAKQLGNSSTVAIAFYAKKNDQIATEDALVRAPDALSEYTRDLYGGAPFKYKLLSDPEISVGPVKPNLLQFVGTGFAIGALLYFLFWFLFDFLRVPAEPPTAEEVPEGKQKETEKEASTADAEAERAKAEKNEWSEESKIESKVISPAVPTSSTAPENLPVAGEEIPPAPNFEEPTDEEVRERLNRLMRGEL